MLQTVRKAGVPESAHPGRCYLCNYEDGLVPAGFQLLYPQHNSAPIPLDWWECHSCRGWFVYPIPPPNIIARYWSGMEWADPDREIQVATAKRVLLLRVLKELSDRIKPGPLLDFGCNFGQFMMLAREAGWKPIGFEPNIDAVVRAREKGFEVRSGWLLENAGFAERSFNAITAIDVFCLVSDPIATVKSFHRLLTPGGVLAMRLTNKRFILGLMRASCPRGSKRDARITNVLLPQFHSIGLAALTRVLEEIGFDRIQALPNATTAPWNGLTWKTRTAYLSASILYYLSLKTVNISPGILLFAQKTIR